MDGRAEAVRELEQAYERAGYLAVAGAADRAVLLGREGAARAEALGAAGLAVRLRHVVGMALGHLRQWDPALAELAVAADEAERIGDPAVRAVVWSTTAWTQARAGRPDDGLRAFARAHAVLEREVPTRDTVIGSINLAMSALQLGLLDVSEHWLDYAREHLLLLPDPARRSLVWGNRSLMEYERGLAEEHAGRPGSAAEWYRRCGLAGPEIEALWAGAPPEPAAFWHLSAAVNQGCCRAKLGDPAGARTLLGPVMDDVDTQTTLMTRLAAHLGLAWAEVDLGGWTAARRHGEEAARLADAIGWTRWQADAHRALARVADRSGDPAGRSAHEARAADLLSQLGWQARLRRLGVSLGAEPAASPPAEAATHR